MALQFPDIDPVALAVGPLQIRWYALAYLVGILIGWAYGIYIAKMDPERRPNRDDIDDFIPWAVLGVILGGRLGYVLFYQFGLYLEQPLAIFKVWEGGMSFHGGALGVIFALIGFSYIRTISLRRMADVACTVVPVGLLFGRLANFINGELYGRASEVSWAMVFPHGGDAARHPSQLYEAGLEGLVLGLILLFMVHQKGIRERPGILTGTFLAGYGISRFIVEFFREPDRQIGYILEVFTMGQMLSVPMILLGLGVIAYAIRKGPQAA